MASKLEPCDCLNWCGDDDRVGKGNVKPCDNMLAKRERERVISQQLATITELRATYGGENILELIEAMHATVAKQREGIALAYAHLWHINTEPMAPIPLYEPEVAANHARIALRELMTNEERGHALNAFEVALAEPDKAA
jgi:hypothetical protein